MKLINKDISESIWRDKYRHGDEQSINESMERVCRAVYANDVAGNSHAALIAMQEMLWCPGGRIHAGAGTNKRVTLINCYVNKTVPDSMSGIMDGLNVAALTQQQGGGIGTDFSTIRPAGAVVSSSGAVSTGIIPFMRIWNAMCATVKSSGARRGAMMGTLAIWHPDVIDFIKAKRTAGELTNFNVSVLVTREFMQAVEANDIWPLGFNVPQKEGRQTYYDADNAKNPTLGECWQKLTAGNSHIKNPSKWYIYREIPARELWEMIIRNTYEYAEPGVIFIDRINDWNNLGYCEYIHCTNPCFTGATKVWTDRGNIPFKDLAGQVVNVLTQLPDGKLVYRKMSDIRVTQRNAEIVRITWGNGQCTYCTPDHEFFVLDGKNWEELRAVSAKNIRTWDRIATPTKYISASSVEKMDWKEDVYCGSVEETHKFFVSISDGEGVLCKNCGEQPLPPNGDCNLGAVNLARMVQEPFTKDARFNFDLLSSVTAIGMRFLDNVLDVSLFPTPEQRAEAVAKRRTGIGIMGLANMLQMCHLRYGSKDAVNMTRGIMHAQRNAAYRASVELAKERGPFPAFDKYKYLARPYIKRLPEDIQQGIAEHGIRNGVIQTIAPTGTTSIYYGNVSSGIEPTFMWKHYRKVLQQDDSFAEFPVLDYGYKKYCEYKGWPEEGHAVGMPDYMVTAMELTVDEHLAMQAAAQEFVDASISKTINCPADMNYEDFAQVYSKAYAMGLKGVTTYRPSGVRGAVLSEESQTKKAVAPKIGQPMKRPDKLMGTTYKIKWPKVESAFYVTINDHVDDSGARRPFEIFINSKSVQHAEWIAALTRCVSAIFRRGLDGGDVTFIVDELEQVFAASGGAFIPGRNYVPSLVALIGLTIREHMVSIGMLAAKTAAGATEVYPEGSLDGSKPAIEMMGDICPKCNQPTLFRQEGCSKCVCGYSSC